MILLKNMLWNISDLNVNPSLYILLNVNTALRNTQTETLVPLTIKRRKKWRRKVRKNGLEVMKGKAGRGQGPQVHRWYRAVTLLYIQSTMKEGIHIPTAKLKRCHSSPYSTLNALCVKLPTLC